MFKAKKVINEEVFRKGDVFILDFSEDKEKPLDVKYIFRKHKDNKIEVELENDLSVYIKDNKIKGIIKNIIEDALYIAVLSPKTGGINTIEFTVDQLEKYKDNITTV